MRIVIAIALLLIAGSASAADIGSFKDSRAPALVSTNVWTGPYIGAHIGGGAANHDLTASETDGEKSVSASLDGLGAIGAIGGASVGYDHQIGRLVLRARADYDFSAIKTELTSGGEKARYEKGDEYSGWLGVGIALDGGTMVYGLGGYTVTEYEFSAGGFSKAFDYDGWAGAVGIEHKLTPAVSVVVEGQYIAFDDTRLASLGGDGARLTLDDGASELRAKAGINWRFGTLPGLE